MPRARRRSAANRVVPLPCPGVEASTTLLHPGRKRASDLAKMDPSRPGASRSWYKAHGLGNDYLVVEDGGDWPLSVEAIQRVCDRTHGVGSDGIVVLLSGGGGWRIRIFNPDGSEAERSGNGLR